MQLDAIAARAADLYPAYAGITAGFHKVEAAMFASGGGSHPWLPLNDRTRPNADPRMILIDTEALEESLGGNSDTTMGPNFIEWTTPIPYAQFHDDGMGHNPHRALIDITPATVLLWDIILNNYVLHGFTSTTA